MAFSQLLSHPCQAFATKARLAIARWIKGTEAVAHLTGLARLNFVKNLFANPWKAIGWFWAVSAGLHAIVLMAPISSPDSLPKDTVVKVTRLQKPRSSEPLSLRPTPNPSQAKPKAKLKQASVRPQLSVSPTKTATTPRPSPVPSPSPTPQPSSVARPKPKPTPSPTFETGAAIAAFSKTMGASTGCNSPTETCWQIADTQWRSVEASLVGQLEAQGFDVTRLDLEDDIGMGVYKISRNGKTEHYLHLLSTTQGTSYVLKDKQLSRGELEQAIGV
ncbi:PepSY domain-containing protein [Kovacikia minuta CCNUW1]|uniref:PepSY domain-containing protein n=1 Tax=Kovacikia minuta TaxID=2931930 RepID=UPI001CCA84E7|nr:PepSY domain-containing protein [Kovacikia minuta]UBF25181.1 PepSY domain-containing protein [Kovacikia minuta CCNUW1]